MVLIRDTSRLALIISLGVSRRSVADWKRRWNRFLTTSLSDSSSCSSFMPRYSDVFMAHRSWGMPAEGRATPRADASADTPLNVGPARHEPAPKRHLVGDTRQ